jgi:hypothetical protein
MMMSKKLRIIISVIWLGLIAWTGYITFIFGEMMNESPDSHLETVFILLVFMFIIELITLAWFIVKPYTKK